MRFFRWLKRFYLEECVNTEYMNVAHQRLKMNEYDCYMRPIETHGYRVAVIRLNNAIDRLNAYDPTAKEPRY